VSAARDSRRALWMSDWCWGDREMLCLLFWPTRSMRIAGNEDVRVVELGLAYAMLMLCLLGVLFDI
jgi:hypothetical protein